MALGDLTARLAVAGSELSGAATVLRRLDPGGGAFGGGAVGRLGELGRELHRDYLAALDSRVREAASHGARLTELADAVAQAAAGYADADEAARRRHREFP
jgi:hypothetical protein